MKTKKIVKVALGVVLFVLVLGVIGSSFTIVPTGYTGVRTTFGQISEENVKQGFNFKLPFVQSINLVNNKQQDVSVPAQVWGESSEKTPVYAADVLVTYQISSEKSSWIYANITDPSRDLVNDSIVASAIKSAMVELPAADVTNRSIIEPLAKEKLSLSLAEKYGEGTVSVLKVVINDMDFEDSYNEAIAAKSIAQQNAERQQIENATAIAKAEADKSVAITNAEAEAEATRIAAQAQAEANTTISQSLTDPVLRSKFYEKWDGKLPAVMSDGSVITDIGAVIE